MTQITIYQISGYLAVVFFIFCAFFAFRIFKFNRARVAWLSIYLATIGLSFFALMHFSADLELFPYAPEGFIKDSSSIMLFLTSALLLWGLWNMSKAFESFNIFSKFVRDKISEFLTFREHSISAHAKRKRQ